MGRFDTLSVDELVGWGYWACGMLEVDLTGVPSAEALDSMMGAFTDDLEKTIDILAIFRFATVAGSLCPRYSDYVLAMEDALDDSVGEVFVRVVRSVASRAEDGSAAIVIDQLSDVGLVEVGLGVCGEMAYMYEEAWPEEEVFGYLATWVFDDPGENDEIANARILILTSAVLSRSLCPEYADYVASAFAEADSTG